MTIDVLQLSPPIAVSGRPARADGMLAVVLLIIVLAIRRGIRRRMQVPPPLPDRTYAAPTAVR